MIGLSILSSLPNSRGSRSNNVVEAILSLSLPLPLNRSSHQMPFPRKPSPLNNNSA
jgi:hypothetical protein